MLALQAYQKALEVRNSLNKGRKIPVCIYDLARELEVEVRFVNDLTSLEGMYSKDSNLILLSSLRPYGRRAFTCAHELGHHIFGHGDRIDKVSDIPYIANEKDPEEYLADLFAGFLLMPKPAIIQAFEVRGLRFDTCQANELYAIAGYFGVGYSTLIHHMRRTLDLFSWSHADKLLKFAPQKIRTQILGRTVKEDLFIVDLNWTDRAIDIQVGDFILSLAQTINDKDCIQPVEQSQKGKLFRGVKPGVERVYDPRSGWAAYVRVSRRDYAGRSIFRNDEDPDYGTD